MKKFIIVFIAIIITLSMSLAGCERQSDIVSRNLSMEADSFNVSRQLTVVNCRMV